VKLKIIFTKEDKKTARKRISGFRQSYVIDARDIVLEFDYVPGQEVSSARDFIVNRELEKRLSQALVNKKSQQIIYFHYSITPELVKNVKQFFKAHKSKVTFCLYDPAKEHKKIHRMFQEVIS
jgi:adenylate kinase family enzyme